MSCRATYKGEEGEFSGDLSVSCIMQFSVDSPYNSAKKQTSKQTNTYINKQTNKQANHNWQSYVNVTTQRIVLLSLYIHIGKSYINQKIASHGPL